jgi:hypothetical protein
VTDDLTPDPPDRRDEHIAELLEVPPLDEVTRRRLVTKALDAAAPVAAPLPRGRRVLAVAAAAVAVVAVGAGVLVVATNDDGGSGSSTVAGRPPTEKGADAGEGASQEAPADTPAPETVLPAAGDQSMALSVPRDLGELGDVTDLDRLRAIVSGGLAAQPANRQALERVARTCLDNRPPGELAPIATGTGRFEDGAVVILVVPTAIDSYEVEVLDAATCAPKETLTL